MFKPEVITHPTDCHLSECLLCFAHTKCSICLHWIHGIFGFSERIVVPQTWVLMTSMAVLQQPIGPVEILGTRWSLPLPLLPSTILSNSLFLSYLKINKYKIACDFQDAYQCYRAHRSSSPSMPPFWPPHRGIVPRSPKNRRTRTTWGPMWLSEGFYKRVEKDFWQRYVIF